MASTSNYRNLPEALATLNRRIEKGEEFPDAAWRVSCFYAIPYEALADAYDDQFDKGNS